MNESIGMPKKRGRKPKSVLAKSSVINDLIVVVTMATPSLRNIVFIPVDENTLKVTKPGRTVIISYNSITDLYDVRATNLVDNTIFDSFVAVTVDRVKSFFSSSRTR